MKKKAHQNVKVHNNPLPVISKKNNVRSQMSNILLKKEEKEINQSKPVDQMSTSKMKLPKVTLASKRKSYSSINSTSKKEKIKNFKNESLENSKLNLEKALDGVCQCYICDKKSEKKIMESQVPTCFDHTLLKQG